jgi:hypothetical protein
MRDLRNPTVATRGRKMLGFSRKLVTFVAIICGFKVLGTIFVPFYSPVYWGTDFYNWVSGAHFVLAGLSEGRLPSLVSTGAYTGLMLLLAPFFWVWTVLPISHPSLAEMAIARSSAEYLLVLIMKIPIIACDLLAGLLTAILVQRATHSDRAARNAFLVWYLNPFNVYWMYYFGGFDVVPTTVVLLAALFGNSRQWFRSGLCLAVAGMLRLFAFLMLPFFIVYAFRERPRSATHLMLSFSAPILLALSSETIALGSFGRLLAAVVNIPLAEDWLLAYFGYSITPSLFRLTAFVLAVQLYLTWRYWRSDSRRSLVHFSIVPLLVLSATSYAMPYHFIWVSPFLTAYYMMERDRLHLFVLTFLFGSLFVAAFNTRQPLYPFLPPLAGFFYGTQGAYLVKLNAGAMRSQIRRILMMLRAPRSLASLAA